MLTHGVIQQHPALTLDNGLLRVVVLPQKGADIYAIVHIPSGVDFMLRTPAGLRPPTGRPPAGFLENYEGGWQVLLPNGNDECNYRGLVIPFHGEAALRAWEVLDERDGPDETAVRLGVRCEILPLRVERWLRLRAGAARLEIEDRVTNEGTEPTPFVWGQHLALGGDFLEAGCRLDTSARTIITPDEAVERRTASLAAGQREPWPMGRGREPGKRVDLRLIPGREAFVHDDGFLTDFDAGWCTVTNPRRRLAFRLDWDATLFRYLALWEPFGGVTQPPPLVGIYGIGLEPWTSRYNLEQAVRQGEAVELAPGASRETPLFVSVAEL
jgi:galactose mutarotase-like enzyme